MGPGGAGPLRQDGAQRDRVRRHAAHRRGLRPAAQRRRHASRRARRHLRASGTRASCSRSSSRSRRRSSARRTTETGKPLVDVILDATGHEGHRQVDGAAGGRAGGADADDRGVARGAHRVGACKAERVGGGEDPAGAAAGAVASSTRSSSSTTCGTRSTRRRSARYAQGMNLLARAVARRYEWNLQLGRIARIWKGGCIIRAQFLGRIKEAYERDAEPAQPARRRASSRGSWPIARRAGGASIALAVQHGLPMPTMTASLAYYDALPARAAAGEPDPGAARLLRRAHLSARRSRRHVPHAVDMTLEAIAKKLREVALTYPETYEEQPWGASRGQVRGQDVLLVRRARGALTRRSRCRDREASCSSGRTRCRRTTGWASTAG